MKSPIHIYYGEPLNEGHTFTFCTLHSVLTLLANFPETLGQVFMSLAVKLGLKDKQS